MLGLPKITTFALLGLSLGTQFAFSQALSEDAAKGLEIMKGRTGQCVLCHQIPNNLSPMGNLGPSLQGVAKRMDAATLRARLADERSINPQTIMPPYFSTRNLSEVDPLLEGKTILSREEFESVMSYLLQLN
jgi:L-cysteine S-thiosulfotransferase